MLARRSLRTKLVAAVTAALLPVLALSAWYAIIEQRRADLRKEEAMATAAQLAAARYRELIECSHRLLVAVCSEDAVRESANPEATPAGINRCEAYLTRVLEQFPKQYSEALITDVQGMARCSNIPTAVGVSFSDREVFRMVRDTKAFALGAQVASRLAPNTVIPAALPIVQDGTFRGMCSVGISVKTVGELVMPAPPRRTVSWRWSIATAARSRASLRRRAPCRSPPALPPPSSAARRCSATTARMARSTNSIS
jgi:hypothetical protein